MRSMLVAAIVLALVTLALDGQSRTFGDGTHLIGLDIQPGIYRAPGGERGERCVWHRLSGIGGTFSEIIAMDAFPQRPTVEILSDDKAFNSEDCGEWAPLIAQQQTASAQNVDTAAGPTAVGIRII